MGNIGANPSTRVVQQIRLLNMAPERELEATANRTILVQQRDGLRNITPRNYGRKGHADGKAPTISPVRFPGKRC